MQHTESIAIFETSSEVIKFTTIGVASFDQITYPIWGGRGVVGHNIDRVPSGFFGLVKLRYTLFIYFYLHKNAFSKWHKDLLHSTPVKI